MALSLCVRTFVRRLDKSLHWRHGQLCARSHRDRVSRPSILSSSWMRGAPQVLGNHAEDEFPQFDTDFSRSKSTPPGPDRRESRVQSNLNPDRSQPTTVSAWAGMNHAFIQGR